MKSKPLLLILLSMAVLALLALSMSDEKPETESDTVYLKKDVSIGGSSETPSTHYVNEQIASNKTSELDSQIDSIPATKRALPINEEQVFDEVQSVQYAKELFEQSTEELNFEAGLSEHNLMILKDLAMRLNELKYQSNDSIVQGAEWPAEMLDALDRLSKAFEAESSFQQAWLESGNTNQDDFQKTFLRQQNQILGKALYERLYAEDSMLVDDSGLSANYPSEETPSLNTEDHKQRLNVLEQWRQDKLSEAELKMALSDSLSSDEINQLIDTGLHEAQWLEKLDGFLDEYRYIEQSGIIGEDELSMRKELIQKHFSEEDRLIVHQFLFSAQSQE